MSLNLFALSADSEQQKEQLVHIFLAWSDEVEKAAPIFDIEGERLESLARDLPEHQYFYSTRAKEAKALVEWLEIQKRQKESRHLKNYNQGARALGANEQRVYIQGEKDIVEMNQLMTEAHLRAQQFEEIVESLKQMGWMIGNITKLRVAELNDVIV